jgi:hypothetical protein
MDPLKTAEGTGGAPTCLVLKKGKGCSWGVPYFSAKGWVGVPSLQRRDKYFLPKVVKIGFATTFWAPNAQKRLKFALTLQCTAILST